MTTETPTVSPSDVTLAIEPPTVTVIADIDVLSEGNLCSCAAGDDNPF